MQHRGKSHLIVPTRTRAATSVVVAAHRWLPARTAVRDSARIVLGIGSRQIRQAFGGSETGTPRGQHPQEAAGRYVMGPAVDGPGALCFATACRRDHPERRRDRP